MAQDLTQKRVNLATNAVFYSSQLIDALNGLAQLKTDRAFLSQDFQDADFTGGLSHLTPGMVGTLFDFVLPSLQTAIEDSANSGRNKQILSQVRK